MSDKTLEQRTDFTKNVGVFEIIVDDTTRQINDHMARIMGMKVDKNMDQSDPFWAPPPFFDSNMIQDPELRAEWQGKYDDENGGLMKRGCVEEKK